MTCLAFSPTEPCLAIGDEAGKITLYYCFTPETEKTPVTALMHWHHRPLNTLSFTADGVYLLSGGEEPVLVMWQLETGHKQFLPRVGGEIKSITISPNQSLYALSEADNSIRIINAVSQQIVRIIQGLQYGKSHYYRLYRKNVLEIVRLIRFHSPSCFEYLSTLHWSCHRASKSSRRYERSSRQHPVL